MSYYECKRCRHITKQKIEMIRHLNRKNKCVRTIDSYNYLDNELEEMSLIRHSNKNNLIDSKTICTPINKKFDKQNNFIINKNESKIKNEIENKKNIDKIINEYDLNTKENIEIIHNDNIKIIDQNKNNIVIDNLKDQLNDNISENIKDNQQNTNESNFTCDICFKIFTRKYNLNRHKKKCSPVKINNNMIDSKYTENKTTNNFNTINNNYNKNLFVNLNLEPFDNDWDVSRITKFTRHSILLSKIMYSNLLDNILQNEKNLNVVIEKETNTGIVYKNNVDKFITMNMQDIIDKSMEKLNKHLKDFYAESLKDDEFVIMDKIFQDQIVNIENKYNEFKNNDEIKKKVEEFITQIYDKKKENALKLYNNTLLKNNDDNGY